MDDLLTHLIALRQLGVEQWPWIGLVTFLFYFWWFRRATSALPVSARKAR